MSEVNAFIFPGQGSQSQGMLAESASKHDAISMTFAEANDYLGFDLWQICQDDPKQQLDQTEYTQPALLAAGVALWRAWQQTGEHEQPSVMAGHSLGEYTALVCAGVLNFQDAIKLVHLRGQLMQRAVAPGQGAMAAIIGLDQEAVFKLCEEVRGSETLTPANFNAYGQVVISGEKPAVERAVDIAKSKGAKLAKLLPVSVPSHCPLMRDAAAEFVHALKQVEIDCQDKIPVINNVDVIAHQKPDELIEALEQQLYLPVRWVECIEAMAELGVGRFIECGPGKVLTGLNKRIVKTIPTQNIEELL